MTAKRKTKPRKWTPLERATLAVFDGWSMPFKTVKVFGGWELRSQADNALARFYNRDEVRAFVRELNKALPKFRRETKP
jgi:hypothetical protein